MLAVSAFNRTTLSLPCSINLVDVTIIHADAFFDRTASIILFNICNGNTMNAIVCVGDIAPFTSAIIFMAVLTVLYLDHFLA